MSKESEEALAVLCKAVQYLAERGEIEVIKSCSPHIRYTSQATLPHFDVIVGSKIIRIDATEIGTHTHKFDSNGACECGEYDEDEDTDLDDRNAVRVPVHKATDLFPK